MGPGFAVEVIKVCFQNSDLRGLVRYPVPAAETDAEQVGQAVESN
jgi:hypothetical protein